MRISRSPDMNGITSIPLAGERITGPYSALLYVIKESGPVLDPRSNLMWTFNIREHLPAGIRSFPSREDSTVFVPVRNPGAYSAEVKSGLLLETGFTQLRPGVIISDELATVLELQGKEYEPAAEIVFMDPLDMAAHNYFSEPINNVLRYIRKEHFKQARENAA